jgi:hypothetical protein
LPKVKAWSLKICHRDMLPHYKHEKNISKCKVHEITKQRVYKVFVNKMKDLHKCGNIKGANIKKILPLNHTMFHKQWQPIPHSHHDVNITNIDF